MIEQIILQATMMQNKKYTLKSIYDDNKEKLYYNGFRNNKPVKKRISYSDFKKVIKTYFEIKFEELFTFGHQTDIRMPLISGYFTIRKIVQKRSFHVLKDNVESKIQGKLVKYKVPILEDWYSVIIWSKRNYNFGKLRVIFSKLPNDRKKSFVSEKGYDNIIKKIIPTS